MKKNIKLFDKKISQFPDIISWAKALDVTELSKFLRNNKANKLFLASGGSYSAAAFAELLSVKKQIMAHAMTPHFYLTSGFDSLPTQTLLISASGANNDICRAFEAGKANNQEMKAITLSSKGKLQSLMNGSESGNVYSYDIQEKVIQLHWILSPNSLKAPSATPSLPTTGTSLMEDSTGSPKDRDKQD